MEKKRAATSVTRKVLNFLIIAFALMVVAGTLFGPPVGSGHYPVRRSATMQVAREIGLFLFQYAQDHQGQYPEGKTSTEVFQRLIDENYVTDLELFYAAYADIPKKVHPTSTHLKAENVSWDVTCCVDSSAPDGLPVVFLTGYKVSYQPGASAIPVIPIPEKSAIKQWLDSGISRPFMAVAFTSSTSTWGKSISARAIEVNEDGTVPNFIPADFDPKEKTYRQLTP